MGKNGDGQVKKLDDNAMICGNCGFCGEIVNRQTGAINNETGVCRRYPPQIIMVNTQVPANVVGINQRGGGPSVISHPQSFLPPVDLENQACGEFTPKGAGNGA